MEDPFARSELLQLMEVGRAAQEHVDLLIGGAMVADGLFLGMPKYRLLWYIQRLPVLRKYLAELYNFSQAGVPPRSTGGKVGCRLYYKGSPPLDIPRAIGADVDPDASQVPCT